MTAKHVVRALLDRLPDDCTLDDIVYHLYVVQSVETGRRQIDEGDVTSHDDVAEELRRRWSLPTDE